MFLICRLFCIFLLFTAVLSSDYPALYPCLDMFMAPFLAKMAADIDEVLVELRDSEASGEDADDTDVFLATFVALNAFGMLLSGVLCVLASKVKLANLASFLPYPVLCGFFSSVGISVWMSAFKVDTGVTIQRVLASGDKVLLLSSFSRHLPSLVVGFLLYKMGPMSPFFLIAIIGATVAVAYSIMALTRTSLEDAQDIGLFWKEEEVMMAPVNDGFHRPWGPPAAFGLWSPSVLRKICWPAMLNGMSDVIAMSLIYLIRCSLHAAALKKNLANVTANCKVNSEESSQVPKTDTQVNNNAVRLEAGIVTPGSKRKPRDVLEVLMSYSNGLFAIAFSGGFPVLPALALGGIFSKLGAHSRSPQYTAVALLFLCYLSDFKIVSYGE